MHAATEYPIRVLSTDDLGAALALVRDVFIAFEAPDYPQRGIDEFMAFIEPSFIADNMADGQLVLWGAYDGPTLAGVAALRPPGHISLLFVDAAHHRQGIARALVAEMIAFARVAGAPALTVHASPYAVDAYRRMDFADSAPETTENGLRFIPMRRLI